MKIVNASLWSHFNDGSALVQQYSATAQPVRFSTIAEILQSECWKTRYQAFAMVYHYRQTNELVLVRDHFGCEPLYYFYDGSIFIFGSTLPDILNHMPFTPELNADTVLALMTGSQVYSDNTFYQKIFRLEPSSMLYLKPGCQPKKSYFWQLSAEAEDLLYPNPATYVEHFTELLDEAVAFHAKGVPHVGSELSGGLDSAAILTSAHRQGIHYPTFIHVADADDPNHQDDRILANILLKHFNIDDVTHVNAEQFEPLAVFHFCAKQFAGAVPYLFFVLAHNVHQAAVQKGCKVLLSGFGGDQCVSGHAPLNHCLPQFLKQYSFKLAWAEMVAESELKGTGQTFLRRAERLLKAYHPFLYTVFTHLENGVKTLQNYFQNQNKVMVSSKRPYITLREREWDLLQGPSSHEVRMRVEYSAVIAKAMGFEYRYPLLYPKLVEFCLRLPLTQKRQNGVSRYLIREYLKQYGVPEAVYGKQQKIGGIVPATLSKCQRYLEQGRFNGAFKDLPYLNQQPGSMSAHEYLIKAIPAYMLQAYTTHIY